MIDDGRVLEAMDKNFHPECFACGSCKRPMMGQCLTVGRFYYHPQCLKCGECSTSLVSFFITHSYNG
jgi:hypothetical protein